MQLVEHRQDRQGIVAAKGGKGNFSLQKRFRFRRQAALIRVLRQQRHAGVLNGEKVFLPHGQVVIAQRLAEALGAPVDAEHRPVAGEKQNVAVAVPDQVIPHHIAAVVIVAIDDGLAFVVPHDDKGELLLLKEPDHFLILRRLIAGDHRPAIGGKILVFQPFKPFAHIGEGEDLIGIMQFVCLIDATHHGNEEFCIAGDIGQGEQQLFLLRRGVCLGHHQSLAGNALHQTAAHQAVHRLAHG